MWVNGCVRIAEEGKQNEITLTRCPHHQIISPSLLRRGYMRATWPCCGRHRVLHFNEIVRDERKQREFFEGKKSFYPGSGHSSAVFRENSRELALFFKTIIRKLVKSTEFQPNYAPPFTDKLLISHDQPADFPAARSLPFLSLRVVLRLPTTVIYP